MKRRTLEQLVDRDDPAWPIVEDWIASASQAVEVLPNVEERRGAELERVQVTTRSPMGAIVYESGGLLVDRGWIRVLGAGHPRLPRGLGAWNEQHTGSVGQAGYLLVADDAIGGFFAVDGGALGGRPGSVFYLCPFSAEWRDLDASYSQFLHAALSGGLSSLYRDARWDGWEADVAALDGASAFTFFPFLSAEGPPIGERHRSAVPLGELLDQPTAGW